MGSRLEPLDRRWTMFRWLGVDGWNSTLYMEMQMLLNVGVWRRRCNNDLKQLTGSPEFRLLLVSSLPPVPLRAFICCSPYITHANTHTLHKQAHRLTYELRLLCLLVHSHIVLPYCKERETLKRFFFLFLFFFVRSSTKEQLLADTEWDHYLCFEQNE